MKDFIIRHKTLTGMTAGVILFSLIPLVTQSPYYLDLLIMMVVDAVLALTFIMMLRTGLINMGIAAFWGLGSYVSTLLVMKAGLSFWVSLPATTLITALVALLIGYILIGSGAGGFSFVMLSLVIGMLFSVLVGSIDYVGGHYGITNVPGVDPIVLPFMTIDFSSKIEYFYLVIFLFIVVVLVANAFYSSWAGRAWKAIGLNPRLAESIGINVNRYKLMSFVVASAIAGLIGSFYAHYAGYVNPDTYGMWVNVYLQINAILGGIGYAILGPVVGSTVMTFVPEFLRMTNEVAYIFIGGLLIVLIMFIPGGLLSLFDKKGPAGGWVSRIDKVIKAIIPTKRENK